MEKMRLEYQELLKESPMILDELIQFPTKVFSGKDHIKPDSKAVFFCYLLPAKDITKDQWTADAASSKWYLYDLASEEIFNEHAEIIKYIRCNKDTPRKTEIKKQDMINIREKMDKHIKNTYLKSVQAPIGVKPILKAWMELS